jgi:hypothetical protein
MHTAGKVFMAIGIILAVGGGILIAMGGNNIDDVGEWDVMEKSVWNGQSGTYDFEDDEDYLVMVRNNVRCDSFELVITNTTSGEEERYESDECTDDGSKPSGYEDDPSGWYHMGSTWYVSNGSHQINANHEIYLVPVLEVLGEEVGEAVDGFLQGLGGIMLLCCGGFFTFLGLVLGLTISEGGQKITVVQQGGMPMGGQVMQQTTMQQPVYQQVAQTPVKPQTTMQQPAEQTVWDQNSPENPF